jgi:hypothetical protein
MFPAKSRKSMDLVKKNTANERREIFSENSKSVTEEWGEECCLPAVRVVGFSVLIFYSKTEITF